MVEDGKGIGGERKSSGRRDGDGAMEQGGGRKRELGSFLAWWRW